MYDKTRLNNGLRIVTYNMPHMESVAVGLWLTVGGRYETKKYAGISHFLEHLLFKGTKKRTSVHIKQSIEGLGGCLNGFTSEEFTCYLVKILKKHLVLSLDVLLDMVLNPKLAPLDIKKERDVIIEEIRMYKDLPSHFVQELLVDLLWPHQPLGMSLTGSEETVKSIGRKELIKHKDKFYNPANIVLAVAGPITHKHVLDTVAGYFSHRAPGVTSKYKKAVETQVKPQASFYFKKTEQMHVSLGTHALHRGHPDKYALSLLHIILGANMSSRLFHEIREKRGLAYAIGSQIRRFKDTGAFIINAGVDNKKAAKSIEVILRELRNLKKKSVKRGELKRAKEFYAGQILQALEDTLDHMLYIGEGIAALDKVDSLDEILKKVNKVTREDIMRVAARIFRTDNLNLAIVGPLDEKNQKRIRNKLAV